MAEQYLQIVFQVAGCLIFTTWAIVGVVISAFYAYVVTKGAITDQEKVRAKFKTIKAHLFSLDMTKKKAVKR